MSEKSTDLLTPHEVAALLRVHPQTLRRWRADGEGPAYLMLSERVLRYRREDIDAWLVDNWRVVDEAADDGVTDGF